MKLSRKKILLHGGREVYILTPETVNNAITATEYKDIFLILTNGTGYTLLSELFALAISLDFNEIIYLPLNFSYMKIYERDFPEKENHCSGIVLFNYCATQINGKDISTALKNKAAEKEFIERETPFSYNYSDRWKIRRKLTVKKRGPLMIISGNGDVFASMAQSAADLAEYGDNAEYNEYPPHFNHNWDEKTSKSPGIILYYWHHNEK